MLAEKSIIKNRLFKDIVADNLYKHNHEECTCGLTVNKALKFDPTRTLTLRRKYASDMYKRFNKIKGLINTSVITNDCFGLTASNKNQIGISLNQPIPRAQFAFKTSAEKVDGFMSWLSKQQDEKILEVITRDASGKVVAHKEWQNIYIESSYKKGIERGYNELNKINALPIEGSFSSSVFFQPIHADAVGLLYTRAFNELQGVTEAMSQQISRVLAQGLIEGRNPREIARILNKTVDNIGINRARMIARTEIIRAHHTATVNSYKTAGIKGVKVQAEWSTAGDSRVCSFCSGMEGTVFTLDEVLPLIPAHPNCRCVAIPYLPDEEELMNNTDNQTSGRFRPNVENNKIPSITNIEKKNNDLLVTLDNGKIYNIGNLHIPSGPPGINGIDGKQGERGPRGFNGTPGKDGSIPDHELDNKTMRIRFKKPDGKWGPWLNLYRSSSGMKEVRHDDSLSGKGIRKDPLKVLSANVRRTVTVITASMSPYTIQSTDQVIYCDTDTGEIILLFPQETNGRWFKIINGGSSNNKVINRPNGTDPILGNNEDFEMIDNEVWLFDGIINKGWW